MRCIPSRLASRAISDSRHIDACLAPTVVDFDMAIPDTILERFVRSPDMFHYITLALTDDAPESVSRGRSTARVF